MQIQTIKKHKCNKQDDRPRIQLRTTTIDRRRSSNLLYDVILGSGATKNFFGNKHMFIWKFDLYDDVL